MAQVILPSGQPRAKASRRERMCCGLLRGDFILADGVVGRDFDLVDADDGDVGEEASSQWGCGGRERGKCEGGGGAGGAAEEFSSSPEWVGHDLVLTI